MALIDEGETDWKVIAIDITDPLAEKLQGLNIIFYSIFYENLSTKHFFSLDSLDLLFTKSDMIGLRLFSPRKSRTGFFPREKYRELEEYSVTKKI